MAWVPTDNPQQASLIFRTGKQLYRFVSVHSACFVKYWAKVMTSSDARWDQKNPVSLSEVELGWVRRVTPVHWPDPSPSLQPNASSAAGSSDSPPAAGNSTPTCSPKSERHKSSELQLSSMFIKFTDVDHVDITSYNWMQMASMKDTCMLGILSLFSRFIKSWREKNQMTFLITLSFTTQNTWSYRNVKSIGRLQKVWLCVTLKHFR